MPSLTRDGVSLAFVDEGSGSPPLTFVHGAGCDRTYFTAQHQHFRRTRRVISLDLRGHGESGAPNEPYPIRGWSDDVAWMMERLDTGAAGGRWPLDGRRRA